MAPCSTLQLCVSGQTQGKALPGGICAPRIRTSREVPPAAQSGPRDLRLRLRLQAGAGRAGLRSQPISPLRRPGRGRGGPRLCAVSGWPATDPPSQEKGSRCRWGPPGDRTWLEQSLWAAAAGVSGYGSLEMKAAAAASVGCKEISAQQIRSQSWTRRRRSTEHLCPAPPCPSNEDSGQHRGSSTEPSWALSPLLTSLSCDRHISGRYLRLLRLPVQPPSPFVCGRHGQPAGLRLL